MGLAFRELALVLVARNGGLLLRGNLANRAL